MTTKDKLICAAYGLIALVALPATWINNIAFMTQAENSSMADFIRAAYVNAATASLSNDLFLLAGAACIFMAIEGRRIGLRYVWLYILLSALIAISVTFPLFLLARHIKLASTPATTNLATSA
jgi:Terpene cyclase DEP1